VRRLAAQAGVDLTTVAGTGPSGRVTTDDVRRAGLVAEPMTLASTATSVVEVDVTAANAADAPLVAYLAAATAAALRAVPDLNGAGGGAIALAVTGDGGSTVLPDAGHLSLEGIARRLGDGGAAAGPPTFALVDAGGRGTLWESSPVPAGQVAALTAGAVVQRPALVPGAGGERVLATRDLVHLALTYDAGRVDATTAARFLAVARDRLT
jgi:2-oxoglutarate dehydrogenase E2 component (dihydrolipoamide succinyltransferase)